MVVKEMYCVGGEIKDSNSMEYVSAAQLFSNGVVEEAIGVIKATT